MDETILEIQDNSDPGAIKYIFGFVIIFGIIISGIRYLTPQHDFKTQRELVNIRKSLEHNNKMLIKIFHYTQHHHSPEMGCKECKVLNND